MHSSADDTDFATALRAAADQIVAALETARPAARVALIDGRSGSGKSTLAADIVARSDDRIQLVALDDLYPGWDGLAAGVEEALRCVIAPQAAGIPGRWRRWDWARGSRAEEHVLDPRRPLLVEGAGLLTPATAALADVAVWLESPASSRKRRALARDGDPYRAHWEQWAAQEARHLAANRPQERATLVFSMP
ncbi:hypothetical protein [Microbacterium sp.]|uniref:hypothetical protein n=1 Tax=Microbacterium sp. TaxID=51671 RepID=UPI0025D034E0|nr:hypothetical protein [Microbacterium sp.]